MAICKFHIPILEFPKERIETILRTIGEAVQDLADFSFIFWQICIAYISETNPFKKIPPTNFAVLMVAVNVHNFVKIGPAVSEKKTVTDRQTDTQTEPQTDIGQR